MEYVHIFISIFIFSYIERFDIKPENTRNKIFVNRVFESKGSYLIGSPFSISHAIHSNWEYL